MSKMEQFLGTVDPFSRAPATELKKLATQASVHTHAKGETVFNEGEDADSVWILQTGRLDIFKFNSKGKPHAIENIGPGQIYGTLCRLGRKVSGYPCTAVAAVKSVSVRVPFRLFSSLFDRYAAVAAGTCTMCSERLHTMQNLTTLAQEPVHHRIAKVLEGLARKHGNDIPMTKREIAQLAATTVETAIRTLGQFEKKGWIKTSRGHITLIQHDQLEALSLK